MHTPSIHISRPPGAGVTAEGHGDELSSLLLRRAGFLPVSTPRSSWWRTPYDLEPAEQQEMATAAYDMLTAARYEVTIAPELRSRPAASAREIKAMAVEITDADNLGTVTELLEDAVEAMAFVPEHMRGLRTAKAVSKASAEPRVAAARARTAETAGPPASVPPPSPAQSPASAARHRP